MEAIGDLDIDFTFWDTPGPMGSAHSVSGDAEKRDPVERLREVVAEVTKQAPPPPRRIGFY